ncbi:cell division protein FtsQ/DivIB [Thermocrinis sp.]
MKKEGKKGWKSKLEYSLAFVWLTAMALAGFFLPGFLSSIPLFKIKDIQVSGVQTISPEVISKACYQASKNNWLFLSPKRILAEVNALTENSIEYVKVDKELHWNGAKVYLTVQERAPIASVVHDVNVLMLDRTGEFFYNPAMENSVPVVHTFSFDYVKKSFPNLKAFIDYIKEMELNIKEIYVTDRNTIAYISGSKVVLPPLSRLDSQTFYRIKKVYNELGMKSTDVLMISRGMAVVKEGE